jgi:LysM repeat protein
MPEAPRPERVAPPRPAPASDARAVYHVVARGETLFSLARRYETTVEDVMRLNRMAAPDLRVGQRLRMR